MVGKDDLGQIKFMAFKGTSSKMEVAKAEALAIHYADSRIGLH